VCVCVFMCVCVCVCVCVCANWAYECVCACLLVCIYACVCGCVGSHNCVCVRTCWCLFIYAVHLRAAQVDESLIHYPEKGKKIDYKLRAMFLETFFREASSQKRKKILKKQKKKDCKLRARGFERVCIRAC